jgi:hypothetical protein
MGRRFWRLLRISGIEIVRIGFRKFYKELGTLFVMKKVVGYVVSILGISVMALGFGMVPIEIKVLNGVTGNVVASVGVGLVLIGVFLSRNKNEGEEKKKVKSGENEIPIYEGVGKKRRVVGYRR